MAENNSKSLAELTDEEFRCLRISEAAAAAGLSVRRFADIEPQPIDWLWRYVFPLGKLSIVTGDPGLGKSLLSIDMAARISRGSPWPDGTENVKGSVVILNAEDDAADTIRPRLDAAGADPKKVYIIDATIQKNTNGDKVVKHFNLSDDRAKLESYVKAIKDVRLVIVDPISAYLGNTDSHVNASVRALLAPLSQFAAQYKCTVDAINHLNKSNTRGPVIYKSIGSIAFTAQARAVWAVAKDKENPESEELFFLPIKMNIGPEKGSFKYRIAVDDQERAYIKWNPQRVDADVNRIMQADSSDDGEPVGALEEAMEFIEGELKDGPKPAAYMLFTAGSMSIAEKTLKRAKKSLKVKSVKQEDKWVWEFDFKGVKEAR